MCSMLFTDTVVYPHFDKDTHKNRKINCSNLCQDNSESIVTSIMSPRININNIPFVVNPYATTAFNTSREHADIDIRQMVREEFLRVFMEITQIGMEACEDFRTVNMYHIANSDTVHDFVRDMSSYEV